MSNGEDYRPWERLGALRRDYEPHRGVLLLCVSVLGLMCGLVGIYITGVSASEPPFRAFTIFGPVFDLAGLWISVWVRNSVRRDSGRMEKGEMDRAGKVRYLQASGPALGGIILNGSLLPVSVALCLMALVFD